MNAGIYFLITWLVCSIISIYLNLHSFDEDKNFNKLEMVDKIFMVCCFSFVTTFIAFPYGIARTIKRKLNK